VKGAHGLQPPGHEHAHCYACGADAVHVEPPQSPELRAAGHVVYAAHNRNGTEAKCMTSRGMVVPDQHRHQPDPT
jgi:hypothetical protein